MMGCRDCSEIKLQTQQKSSLNVKAVVSKQAIIDSNGKPVTSLRWNPTSEQLFALEELYRCGTQSPSAQQIQQITCRLRRFGKIEGKNVFYWFQNHKARERQKRSRDIKSVPREKCWNEIGLPKKRQEFQQAKMWLPQLKSSSNTLPNQECLSVCTPSMPNTIRHFRVFETVDGLFSKQRAWKSMDSSSVKQSSEIQDEYLTKFSIKNVEDKLGDIQTLELFPLRSSGDSGTGVPFSGDVQKPMNNNLSSRLFFEFLPLKN